MPKENTYDVFISYRRQNGAVKAELTKDELVKRGFRESRMFFDTRSISSGDYLKTILNAIANSRNIIVIITKDCFKDPPTDSTWVREIEYAIELHKNIVPIFFDGINDLKAEELPSCIQSLAFENAVLYIPACQRSGNPSQVEQMAHWCGRCRRFSCRWIHSD